MRRMTAMAMAALALAGAAAVAEAKQTEGKLGIGAALTPGGVSGLDVVRWFGGFGLNGTLGLTYASPERGDSQTGVALGIGGIFPLMRGETAELSIGGRLDLGYKSGAQDSATQVSLEVPLRVEWWATDSIALAFEVGAVVELIPAEGRVLAPLASGGGNGEGTGLSLGGTALTGGAGFHFYF